MTIVFATNNNHKLSEIQDILGSTIEVKSLKDIGCHVDIPETGTTLEENAQIKANYVWDNFQTMVFADDTGLEIDALMVNRAFIAHVMQAERGMIAKQTYRKC